MALLAPLADEPEWQRAVIALRWCAAPDGPAARGSRARPALPERRRHGAGGSGLVRRSQAHRRAPCQRCREHIRRPVQTNEPGRSAVLFGGLLHVASRTAKPLRLLEIGASAGLNLLVDRYAYELTSGRVLGDPDSALRLVAPWQGDLPAGSFEIVERLGCDPNPLEPRSTADRLTLTSYVWGDQLERFERLRGALQVAARTTSSSGRRPRRTSSPSSWLSPATMSPPWCGSR